jgi:hypothetical protein
MIVARHAVRFRIDTTDSRTFVTIERICGPGQDVTG